MARTPLFNFRLDDATKARWEAAAADRGDSLTSLIFDAVEREIADDARGRATPGSRPARTNPSDRPRAKGKRERTEMCKHRIPPDRHCSRCDVSTPPG